jgi:hypothetical protein
MGMMTDRQGGPRRVPREETRGLDRLRPPDPMKPRSHDLEGKRAIYSVDPDANPTPVVLVRCARCDVERGLTLQEAKHLLSFPMLVHPLRWVNLWTRCPTCSRRAWIRVKRGPGIPWPF